MRNILTLGGLLFFTGTAVADARVEDEWMTESYPADVTLVEGVDMVTKEGVTLCLTTDSNVENTTEIVIDCNGHRTLRTITVSKDPSMQVDGLEVINTVSVTAKFIAPSGVQITDEIVASLYREALDLNLSDDHRLFIEEALKRLEGDFSEGSVLHRETYNPYSTYRITAIPPSGRWAWGRHITTAAWHEIDVTINMGALYSWERIQKINGVSQRAFDSESLGAGSAWKQSGYTFVTTFISKPGIYETYASTALSGGGLDGMAQAKGRVTAK
ncbi:hypothetical protein [uncultured Vibrio sp.]|uniref:hypothetical protein n=1 Tax=uncultured Vibrio sp. TaxID=114054 RepID=UPI00261CD2D5|nr:hypothetical protein [uncultured Vibrio sp.]